MESSSNWQSGLKTLPRNRHVHRFASPERRLGSPGTDVGRWDLENEKVLAQRSRSAPHRRPQNDLWSSGLKTLENSRAVKPSDKISEISKRPDHGTVTDWEYTSTLHKTLEIESPKPTRQCHDSWLAENNKVLPQSKSLPRELHFPHSPLETETVPVPEWSAGQKVVPANRRRRFLTNNQSDLSHRTSAVQRDSHLPNDGTWNTENFKTLETRKQRRGHTDPWEAGIKVVPESNLLARDRHYSRISHPHSWFDESLKTLPYEKSHKPNITRFTIENTGWDSALFKTFDPAEQSPGKYGPRARIAFAANHDWHVDGKVVPPEEQHRRHKITIAGTGWDSGLKTLPRGPALNVHPTSSRVPVHSRGYWDVDNGKTLGWEEEQTSCYLGEGNRHVLRPRHMDMVQFHQRMCRHQDIYAY